MVSKIITEQKENKIVRVALENTLGKSIEIDQKAIEHRSAQVSILKGALSNLRKSGAAMS